MTEPHFPPPKFCHRIPRHDLVFYRQSFAAGLVYGLKSPQGRAGHRPPPGLPPKRRYQELELRTNMPELAYSRPVMATLALMPKPWRRVMDRGLPIGKDQAHSLKQVNLA